MKKQLICSVLFLLFMGINISMIAGEQENLVSMSFKKCTFKDVILEMKKQTNFKFMYKKKDVDLIVIKNLVVENEKAEEVIKRCLKGKPLTYEIDNDIFIFRGVQVESLQQEKKEIKGKVLDEKGLPMPGVTLILQGTSHGVSTDARGRFTINAKKGDVLKFSFIGYKTEIILIDDKTKIEVQLNPDVHTIEEQTVVAFGTQKKESVVSAITTVKAEDLRSSSSDLTSAFAGKIAGLIGWQTTGIPGALTEEEMGTKFYLRGITSYQSTANTDPLILMDGVEISKLDLSRVNVDDIESFNVMKDASATAMYGARGANGVISLVTKKGKAGNVYTSFRYERIWSEPTREIDIANPIEYMNLYNEALTSRNPEAKPRFTKQRIENTYNPNYPSWLYPATNWYKQIFKDMVVNNHYTLNVRGGTQKIQYYASLAHNIDNGMLKADQINDFDPNIKNKQTNIRINLNVNLNKTAKLVFNSFSTYDDYTGPIQNVSEAYYLAFVADPVAFAPTYPIDDKYTWPHIRFGGKFGEGIEANPYASIQQGYKERMRFSTINKFEYIQSLSKFIKGLEFRGSLSISRDGYFTTAIAYVPALYALIDYDHTTGEHTLAAINEAQASKNLTIDRRTEKEKTSNTIIDYQAKFLHSAAWKDHQTSFTGVFQVRERKKGHIYTLFNSFPERNLGLSFRGTYGYKDKYFLEASVGINGSERFAKGNKIGAFPSVSAGWIVNRENFMRSTEHWLTFLKLRGSYGKVGNDGVIKDPRFVYLQNIESLTGLIAGQKNSYMNYNQILDYGNKETRWEVNEQTNLAVDLKLFKGLIESNIDIYQETRHNIYANRYSLPVSMGLERYPLDDYGKVRSRGMDISFKLQDAISKDFWYVLNGSFTYNKATFLVIEEPTEKKEWQKKVGHDISQQYAYVAEGLFRDWEEIKNSPVQDGEVMPGDIKYRDIDGNGIIDVNDAVLAGYPETPRIIYGFGGFLHYKGLELNISFQGSGNRSFFIDPAKISPLVNNRAVLTAIADDHWTPDNHSSMPFWPRLSTQSIVDHNPQELYYKTGITDVRKSTYFMKNGKFLRCKQIGITYYLNKKWLENFRIKNCKIYANIDNAFLISDFDVWDIELGESGFNYPIQRTYSLGVNFSF